MIEARFGWGPENLYVLLVPRDATDLQGLQLDLTVSFADPEDDSVFHLDLAEGGWVDATCSKPGHLVV